MMNLAEVLKDYGKLWLGIQIDSSLSVKDLYIFWKDKSKDCS